MKGLFKLQKKKGVLFAQDVNVPVLHVLSEHHNILIIAQ